MRAKKAMKFARTYARRVMRSDVPPDPRKLYQETSGASDGLRAYTLLNNQYVSGVIANEILKHNSASEIARDIKSLRRATQGVYFDGKKVADEPAWTPRTAAIQILMKALAVGGDAAPTNQSVNFNVSNLDAAQIRQIADSLADVSRKLTNAMQASVDVSPSADSTAPSTMPGTDAPESSG